ncbi:MAG: hypothetical protein ABSB73_12980 [Solirubrobacteraceae bacterium]|jgi:hypothetical protein
MPDAVNFYNVGDLVQLTATFSVIAGGEPVDPSAVQITVCDPDLNETTPFVSNPQVGVFTALVSVTLPGKWRWRATGTGAAQASADGLFIVRAPTF